MNDLERIVFHAARIMPYPHHDADSSVLHATYMLGGLANLFDLPIVTCVWCAEPGCDNVSAYGEPGYRCWEHSSS